jgi:hypothetical protein
MLVLKMDLGMAGQMVQMHVPYLDYLKGAATLERRIPVIGAMVMDSMVWIYVPSVETI